MNNDADRGGLSKLWSGGAAKEKASRPEPERTTEKVVPLHPEDRSYTAFQVREHPPSLHIHCATLPSHYPAYSSLLNIIFDHTFERAFTLVYSFMLVEVTGNNLGAVVHAINYRNCERINEFHAKLYDHRPAPNEPIIEGIKITAAVEKLMNRDGAD
jgi:hypothetical protein